MSRSSSPSPSKSPAAALSDHSAVPGRVLSLTSTNVPPSLRSSAFRPGRRRSTSGSPSPSMSNVRCPPGLPGGVSGTSANPSSTNPSPVWRYSRGGRVGPVTIRSGNVSPSTSAQDAPPPIPVPEAPAHPAIPFCGATSTNFCARAVVAVPASATLSATSAGKPWSGLFIGGRTDGESTRRPAAEKAPGPLRRSPFAAGGASEPAARRAPGVSDRSGLRSRGAAPRWRCACRSPARPRG